MKQQPDKFFREKLKDYSPPVPPAAWERIEASLEKKTTPIFEWWKIAAAVLVLTCMGYLLWYNSAVDGAKPLAHSNNTQGELKENVQRPMNSDPIVKNETSTEQRQTKASDVVPKKINKKNQDTTVNEQTKKSAAFAGLEKKPSPAVDDSFSPIENNIVIPENDVPVDNASIHAVAASKTPSRTLTFSVEETNQYLDKNALAQATSDEKKSSTFKKLLQKAGDLKNNQDPFGDLREMKNEILALNLKNEKRGQNK